MRKVILSVVFLLFASSVFGAVFPGHEADCKRPIRVGWDPKVRGGIRPGPGQEMRELAEPLCVGEDALHANDVRGWIPAGKHVILERGEKGYRVIAIAECGNGVHAVYSDLVLVDNSSPASSIDDYYEDGVPATEQPRRAQRAEPEPQQPASDGMTREEFLLAIKAMQTQVSGWDRFMQGFQVVTTLAQYRQQGQLIKTLKNPIKVQPVKCVSGNCGLPSPTRVVPNTPAPCCATNRYPVNGGLPPLGGH